MKWMIGLLLLAGLLALGIVPRLWNRARLGEQARQDQARLLSVQVVQPRQVKTSVVSLPGSLEAVESTAIGSRSSGYLASRSVDIGSRVRRGQLLAVVSAPDQDLSTRQAQAQFAQSRAATSQARAGAARGRATLAQSQASLLRSQAQEQSTHQQRVASEKTLATAKANLRRLRATMDLARITYDRYAEMGKAGAASDQQVDEKRGAWEEARASHDAGQSAVSQAEAQLAAAQADESAARADVRAAREVVNAAASSLQADSAAVEAALAAQDASSFNSQRSATMSGFERIVAPFDGVIVARNVEVGSLVSGGTAASEHGSGLFTIAHVEHLKAVAEVPESAAPSITLGMDVEVEVRDLPGEVLKGKVWRRSGALNQNSRTLHVEVLLDNPGRRADPGLYCRMRFKVPSVAWLLPSTALRVGADGTQVVQVRPDGKVQALNVTVSRDLGKEIQLIHKFKGDERIVADPAPTLRDGTSVQVQASP